MISVVILAHNEADEIGGLLDEFSAFEGLELIIAEDASTDHTPDIVQEFATDNSNVILSSSPVLAGKGAALRRGLALATGDVLGFLDGDASIHPNDFMRVAATIDQGADLAVGSRKLRGSVIAIPQPLSRRLSGAIYPDARPPTARHSHTRFSVRLQSVSARGVGRHHYHLRWICV